MAKSRTTFSFEDAWVFSAISASSQSSDGVPLRIIIGHGDYLNHAIFTLEELNSAFSKLASYQLIEFINPNVKRTNIGDQFYQNGIQRKGGAFSTILNMQKALNSPFIKLPEFLSKINTPITDTEFMSAYNAYKKKGNQTMKKTF